MSLVLLITLPVQAVELFGVTVLGDKAADQVEGLAYEVTIEVLDAEATLKAPLSQASLLVTQSKRGAADIFALAARARSDADRLVAALYMQARYSGSVDIRIAGHSLDDLRPEDIEVAAGAPVAVAIVVTPGPEFTFGNVVIGQSASTSVGPPDEPHHYGLVTGAPARSEIIIAALDRLIEQWRAAGYPFAQIETKDIAADHARSAVDIKITVAPGGPAVYGWINVAGARDLSAETIADQSALQPGRRFSPADLKVTRERLRKLESIETVRIVEGQQIDADGGIPITLEVTERKPRFFGATASLSTLDGAEVQAYWGHRNLFGEGERLRVDGSVSQIGSKAIEDLEFDAGAVFSKPGILDIDTELFSEFRIKRERPDVFENRSALAKVGLSHTFSPALSGSLAAQGEFARVEDAYGIEDYVLLSAPGELVYDSRDDRLDPASGISAMFHISPTVDVAGGAAFVATHAQIASYVPLDDSGRAVLAGRIIGGSVFGADLADVPATARFFAGGGGSVRGYEFRSLGPAVNGDVVGGLSTAGALGELRLRVTEQFGIVPFFDVAVVSADSVPSFSEAVYVGAGVGIRYYTSLGPLRLDVAVPLTNRERQSDFGVYVGLGQTF